MSFIAKKPKSDSAYVLGFLFGSVLIFLVKCCFVWVSWWLLAQSFPSLGQPRFMACVAIYVAIYLCFPTYTTTTEKS